MNTVENTKDMNQFYDSIFLMYYSLIYSLVKKRIWSDEEAKDLTQDVFVEAWRSIDKLAQHESVVAWLVVTAKYKIADKTRKIIKDDKLVQRMIYQSEADKNAESHSSSAAKGFLEKLPPEDLELLINRYDKEMEYEDIGKLLGISAAAAQKRVSRIRQKLIKMMSEKGYYKKILGICLIFWVFADNYSRRAA